MTNRERVIDFVKNLPADMPMQEIVRELYAAFEIKEHSNTVALSEALESIKDWERTKTE